MLKQKAGAILCVRHEDRSLDNAILLTISRFKTSAIAIPLRERFDFSSRSLTSSPLTDFHAVHFKPLIYTL